MQPEKETKNLPNLMGNIKSTHPRSSMNSKLDKRKLTDIIKMLKDKEGKKGT